MFINHNERRAVLGLEPTPTQPCVLIVHRCRISRADPASCDARLSAFRLGDAVVNVWPSWLRGCPARGLGGEFGAASDAELGEGVFEVGLDGGAAHEEAFGDLRIGHALGDDCHDLKLCWSEAGPAVTGSFPLAASSAGVGTSVAPIELVAVGDGGVGSVAERVCGGGSSEFYRLVLEGKSPPVAGLVAQTLGGAEEP